MPPPSTPIGPVTPRGPNGPLTVVSSVVSGSELRIAIEGTPLTTIGGVARATDEVRGLHRFLLLTRVSHESVAVLNGTCTHEGCTVSQFIAPHFECPCHGSRFEWSGTLVRGPAAAALPRLDGRFDGRVITVSFP